MNLDYTKNSDGLVPAVIQDSRTRRVLMLGYMNREALEKTVLEGRVTFYSRTKRRLWTKGETSGCFLEVDSITKDCDGDTLLIRAAPAGPVCHTGADTCFGEQNTSDDFMHSLETLLQDRKRTLPAGSYTASLFKAGVNKIACKVGEEAAELIVEAKDDKRELFLNEAADLLFHVLVLLVQKKCSFQEVVTVLKTRRT